MSLVTKLTIKNAKAQIFTTRKVNGSDLGSPFQGMGEANRTKKLLQAAIECVNISLEIRDLSMKLLLSNSQRSLKKGLYYPRLWWKTTSFTL